MRRERRTGTQMPHGMAFVVWMGLAHPAAFPGPVPVHASVGEPVGRTTMQAVCPPEPATTAAPPPMLCIQSPSTCTCSGRWYERT
jgi:hypothetical protein